MPLVLKYLRILPSFSRITYFPAIPFCVTSGTQYLPLNMPLLLCSFMSSSLTCSKTIKNWLTFICLDFSASSFSFSPLSSLLILLFLKLSLASTSSYHALLPFYSLGLFNHFFLPKSHPHFSPLHFGVYHFASISLLKVTS